MPFSGLVVLPAHDALLVHREVGATGEERHPRVRSKVEGRRRPPLDAPTAVRPGRNDSCPCGSGRKYKQCCLDKDEAKLREARAKVVDAAPVPAEEGAAATPAAPSAPKHATHQPWKKGGSTNTRGFQRMSTPRKVGGG
jgi:SEC-C motif-containing protein